MRGAGLVPSRSSECFSTAKFKATLERTDKIQNKKAQTENDKYYLMLQRFLSLWEIFTFLSLFKSWTK